MNTRRRVIQLVTTAAIAVSVRSGRRALLDWGADDDERRQELPGDEVMGGADLVSTRAITINCSPAEVWPWIAQLGQGRGGFYSYDALENVFGCEMRSAVRIHPAWQHPQVGDDIRLHPNAALGVAVVQPDRALVLHGSVPIGRTPPFDFSWAFVLGAGPSGATRLIVRERYCYLRWFGGLIVEPTELVSFLMSRKMLHGIRHRAEHHGEHHPRPSTVGD